MRKFNFTFIAQFQTPLLAVIEANWLQNSIRLGGKQSGSNYNARIEYVFVRRDSTSEEAIDTGVNNILAPLKYTAALDRKIYDRWYDYNQRAYCVPGVTVNPDLGIVAGTSPTLYGEVESGHHNDIQNFMRLDQCTSRILSYTDKCFALYAKGDVLHFRFYQTNNSVGTMYVLSDHFNHSPSDQMQNTICKSLQNAVYGKNQGGNVYLNGFDKILMRLVKIVMFMEPRAIEIYKATGICDQFTSQENDHTSPHPLNTATFPTSRGFYEPSIVNGPQKMSHIKMWKWKNMKL